MYRLMVILLLLFELHFNASHLVKKAEFPPKDDTDGDVYAVITKSNGKLEFLVPKPQEPTLREILYYSVVEKPYNVEEKPKPLSVEQTLRPFTNGHGYQYLLWGSQEDDKVVTNVDDTPEISEESGSEDGEWVDGDEDDSGKVNKSLKTDVTTAEMYEDDNDSKVILEWADTIEDDDPEFELKTDVKTEKFEGADSKTLGGIDEDEESKKVKNARNKLFDDSKQKYIGKNRDQLTSSGRRQKREMIKVPKHNTDGEDMDKMKKRRKQLFDDTKQKYAIKYGGHRSRQENSGRRHKRQMVKNIPPPPTLSPLNVDQLPELIRRMLSEKGNIATEATITTERTWGVNNMNNGEGLVINNTLSFPPPPNTLNLKSNYVPKTYGMSLSGNNVITWNNLSEPRRPQDINFNIYNQDKETKPKESNKVKLVDTTGLLQHKLNAEIGYEGTRDTKIDSNQKDIPNNIVKQEYTKPLNVGNEIKIAKEIKSIEEPSVNGYTETKVKPSSFEAPHFVSNDNAEIDLKNQMQEMFARFVPPVPNVEEAKNIQGTYGMRLTNGQGEIWNNLAKPQGSVYKDKTVFTTQKPHTDNQSKNIEPVNPEIQPEMMKVFQKIYEEEEKIRNDTELNENLPENNDPDFIDTIPTIIFNEDDWIEDDSKIINLRSNEQSKFYNESSTNDNSLSENLPEIKVNDKPASNMEIIPNKNNVHNDKDSKIDEIIQEKMEKSFQEIMNKISGWKPIQLEIDTNKGLIQNPTTSGVNSNSNIVNKNNIGRGMEGTYGMQLIGDQGYVWNKLSPSYYDYHIGEQPSGNEVTIVGQDIPQATTQAMVTITEKNNQGTVFTSTTVNIDEKETIGTTEDPKAPESSTDPPCATTDQITVETTTTTMSNKPVANSNTESTESNVITTVSGDSDNGLTESTTNDSSLSTNTTTEIPTSVSEFDKTTNENTTPATTPVEDDGPSESTTKPSNPTPFADEEATTIGVSTSITENTTPADHNTTDKATEATTTVQPADENEKSTTNTMTSTTESIKETTIYPSQSDEDSTTSDIMTNTEPSVSTTISTIGSTTQPAPTNNSSKPLNLNDLLQTTEFWDWLSKWTIPFMEVMNETVTELVKEEVAKQLAEIEANKTATESDKNNSITEKPTDKEESPNADKSKNNDTTPMKVEAQTIYGNSLNGEHITNIFVFYPNNKTLEDLKPLLNNTGVGGNGITTSKPNENSITSTTSSISETTDVVSTSTETSVPENENDIDDQGNITTEKVTESFTTVSEGLTTTENTTEKDASETTDMTESTPADTDFDTTSLGTAETQTSTTSPTEPITDIDTTEIIENVTITSSESEIESTTLSNTEVTGETASSTVLEISTTKVPNDITELSTISQKDKVTEYYENTTAFSQDDQTDGSFESTTKMFEAATTIQNIGNKTTPVTNKVNIETTSISTLTPDGIATIIPSNYETSTPTITESDDMTEATPLLEDKSNATETTEIIQNTSNTDEEGGSEPVENATGSNIDNASSSATEGIISETIITNVDQGNENNTDNLTTQTTTESLKDLIDKDSENEHTTLLAEINTEIINDVDLTTKAPGDISSSQSTILNEEEDLVFDSDNDTTTAINTSTSSSNDEAVSDVNTEVEEPTMSTEKGIEVTHNASDPNHESTTVLPNDSTVTSTEIETTTLETVETTEPFKDSAEKSSEASTTLPTELNTEINNGDSNFITTTDTKNENSKESSVDTATTSQA